MLQDNEKVSIDDIKNILKYVAKGYKVESVIYETLKKIAIKEIEEKKRVVLYKRDPNVERGRIQGAYVKVIDNNTLEIHPSIVGGFGADFDGDTMSIFTPLSVEAQNEVKTKMITTDSFERINAPNFTLSKEMNIGLFTLTFLENKDNPILVKSVDEAKKLNIATPVKFNSNVGLIVTTAGRVVFNSVLPQYIPFNNKPMNSKDVNQVLSLIITKSKTDFAKAVDAFCKMGFEYATMYPQTISLDMFIVPPELKNLATMLSKEPEVSKQVEILSLMESKLKTHLKENVPGLYIQIESGAAKGGSQLRQIMIAKGLINDAMGNLMAPICKSLNDGYTPVEYFEASAGSRKGIIDRAINTAFGGYAYRKMVYAVGSTEVNIQNADCGTKRGIKIKLSQDWFNRMQGRYMFNPTNRKIERLTSDYIGKLVEVRSPIFCKSRQICRTCYGDLVYQIKSRNAGLLAAQACASLSEKIMKCSTGYVETESGIISLDELWNKSE